MKNEKWIEKYKQMKNNQDSHAKPTPNIPPNWLRIKRIKIPMYSKGRRLNPLNPPAGRPPKTGGCDGRECQKAYSNVQKRLRFGFKPLGRPVGRGLNATLLP